MKRNWAAVMLALLIAALVWVAGCSKDSSNPAGNDGDNNNYPFRITSLISSVADLHPGDYTMLTCIAEDDSGATLYYSWDSNGMGIFASTDEAVVNWTAPDSAGTYPITVYVSEVPSPSDSVMHVQQTINIVVSENPAGSITVSNPNPADGSTTSTFPTQLTWSVDNPNNIALQGQIYFGTSNLPNGTSSVGADLSYPVSDLQSNTTYYWQVNYSDGNGNTIHGPIWSFTTGGFGSNIAGHTWVQVAIEDYGDWNSTRISWNHVSTSDWRLTTNQDGTYSLESSHLPTGNESGTYDFTAPSGTTPGQLTLTSADTSYSLPVVALNDAYMVTYEQDYYTNGKVLVKADEHDYIVAVTSWGSILQGQIVVMYPGGGSTPVDQKTADAYGIASFNAPSAFGTFDFKMSGYLQDGGNYLSDPVTVDMQDEVNSVFIEPYWQ